MQEIRITQQCTNNSTMSSQQKHRRSSTSDLLSKFAERKVTVPSQSRSLCKGRGRGVQVLLGLPQKSLNCMHVHCMR